MDFIAAKGTPYAIPRSSPKTSGICVACGIPQAAYEHPHGPLCENFRACLERCRAA
jgi:hypothetical protein